MGQWSHVHFGNRYVSLSSPAHYLHIKPCHCNREYARDPKPDTPFSVCVTDVVLHVKIHTHVVFIEKEEVGGWKVKEDQNASERNKKKYGYFHIFQNCKLLVFLHFF